MNFILDKIRVYSDKESKFQLGGLNVKVQKDKNAKRLEFIVLNEKGEIIDKDGVRIIGVDDPLHKNYYDEAWNNCIVNEYYKLDLALKNYIEHVELKTKYKEPVGIIRYRL